MLIACISDIHDRIDSLDRVLERVRSHGPDVLVCCGDLTKSATLLRLADSFDKEIHLAQGNMDVEDEIKGTIEKTPLLSVYYHQLLGRLTLDKKHVAFTHKPRDAEALLNENFDVVFYGHTHEAKLEQHGETYLVNPGDVQGRFGRAPSYALYDTESGKPTLHTVD